MHYKTQFFRNSENPHTIHISGYFNSKMPGRSVQKNQSCLYLAARALATWWLVGWLIRWLGHLVGHLWCLGLELDGWGGGRRRRPQLEVLFDLLNQVVHGCGFWMNHRVEPLNSHFFFHLSQTVSLGTFFTTFWLYLVMGKN